MDLKKFKKQIVWNLKTFDRLSDKWLLNVENPKTLNDFVKKNTLVECVNEDLIPIDEYISDNDLEKGKWFWIRNNKWIHSKPLYIPLLALRKRSN